MRKSYEILLKEKDTIITEYKSIIYEKIKDMTEIEPIHKKIYQGIKRFFKNNNLKK